MQPIRPRRRAASSLVVAALVALGACSDARNATTTTTPATDPSPVDTVGTAPLDTAGTTPDGTTPDGTGTAPTGDTDYSVVASLQEIPRSAMAGGDTVNIVSGDLDRATALAGATRPAPGADSKTVLAWASAITGLRTGSGASGVAVQPAEALGFQRLAQLDEIDHELGWSVLDVSSYVELQAPPQFFSVMRGTFDEQAIDAAQGDRVDGIWKLGGDDMSIDVKGISAARPLGQALRTAVHDGRLAQARSTPPIKEWLAGGATLADDAGLHDVAAALDDEQVYGAMLVRSDFGGAPSGAGGATTVALAPFDTIGVGSDHDDAGAVLVLAYHCDDEQAAQDNTGKLRTLFTEGASSRTKQPWSELVHLDDVRQDGAVVVATMHLLDGRSPTLGVQGVLARESFATHV